ncbi:membrane protein [Desulfolithobacter dissulfuricans]|uniref:Membrane protein n=1 Tax=Desulfolithobacter dissulfuricans TaxID=2795293 RepID=A0A915U194_9BACT|nr:AEC family transporter [Desulfolithobacter dissulfuricans]BCO08970.1 membrane protein [Desulfolithobacter dissulfuricans]
MGQVIEIVLPVFLVIALGYGIRRFGLVDDLFITQVNGLVFYVCLPLLLFYKIGQADFSVNFNPQLVLATSVATGCCFVLAYLYGKWRDFPPAVHGVFCQGSFRGNLAYIGLAIVYNGYGDAGLTRAGILLGFLVPVLNFFAILALILPQRRQRTGYPEIVKMILVNPLILASLVGILWSFFELPIPTILDRSLHIASGMTLPLALLSIGGSFSLKNLRGDFCMAALATTMKLVLLPLITAALMLLLGITGLDFAIGLLMAGAPTAVATYIMASQMGADGELAGTIVMMATGFSALSYTLLLLSLHAFGM